MTNDTQNTPARQIPAPVQMAWAALEILKAENATEAEQFQKILAGVAMRLSKEGAEVTVESLLAYARLGIDNLPETESKQNPLTYAEVVTGLKPLPPEDVDDVDKNANEEPPENLTAAARAGNIDAVRLWLDRDADIDQKDGLFDLTALMLAAQSGHLEIVRLLLDRRANIDQKDDSFDLTALMLAALGKHVEIMHLLHDRGASLKELDAGRSGQMKEYRRYDRRYKLWQKTARCAPPQGLAEENPAGFKAKDFAAVTEMLATENYSGKIANQMGFAALALFGTEQRVLQYLAKWGEAGKQPLHDIIHFIKAPSAAGADVKAWGDAALKCGPSMAKLFSFADRLPQPEHSADVRTWSYLKTLKKVAQFAYKRAGEHLELTTLCFENMVDEEDFNTALTLVKKQKTDVIKNMPDITIDGKNFDMEDATFHRLPTNDVRGLFLGELTNCCQSIGGVGADCAEHGFTSKDGGFYVVETKDKEIIGQTWAWRGQKGELVFDSLETLGSRVTSKQWTKLTTAFAKALAKQPDNVTALNIGCGGATPASLIAKFNKAAAAEPVDYDDYRDSHKQVSVWKAPKPRRS